MNTNTPPSGDHTAKIIVIYLAEIVKSEWWLLFERGKILKGHENSVRNINSLNAFPLIWKHEYHFSSTAADRRHRKIGFSSEHWQVFVSSYWFN